MKLDHNYLGLPGERFSVLKWMVLDSSAPAHRVVRLQSLLVPFLRPMIIVTIGKAFGTQEIKNIE